MHIVVIGTRGIPEIQGGVETHCQELYPHIVKLGHQVTVIRRTPYINDNNHISEYKGVHLIDVYAPRKKSFEAIIHTFLAVIKARRLKADILHIHAIGPALMTPFARLLGLKVVMTNHGPDYDRQKWSYPAKMMLKLGERFGSKYSNKIIVISKVISDIISSRYNRTDTNLIFNGVTLPVKSQKTDYIQSLGLTAGKYIVAVGRFVKEKGFHDLIEAFASLDDNYGYRLAIAGDADHPDEYSEHLKKEAIKKGVVLTGFIRGEKMNQLMTNAAIFVIPSYHEGLPFSLLEAMSFNLDVIASDIPANKLDCLNSDDFYNTGNIISLKNKIQQRLSNGYRTREYNLDAYHWPDIARQTCDVYNALLNRKEKK